MIEENVYKNRQFEVTEYGVEAIAGSPAPTGDGLTPEYFFEAARLDELTERNGESLYDWPVHMAEKSWVGVDEFNEAFEQACHHHGVQLDPEILVRSKAFARKIASKPR